MQVCKHGRKTVERGPGERRKSQTGRQRSHVECSIHSHTLFPPKTLWTVLGSGSIHPLFATGLQSCSSTAALLPVAQTYPSFCVPTSRLLPRLFPLTRPYPRHSSEVPRDNPFPSFQPNSGYCPSCPSLGTPTSCSLWEAPAMCSVKPEPAAAEHTGWSREPAVWEA